MSDREYEIRSRFEVAKLASLGEVVVASGMDLRSACHLLATVTYYLDQDSIFLGLVPPTPALDDPSVPRDVAAAARAAIVERAAEHYANRYLNRKKPETRN